MVRDTVEEEVGELGLELDCDPGRCGELGLELDCDPGRFGDVMGLEEL